MGSAIELADERWTKNVCVLSFVGVVSCDFVDR